MLREKPLFNRFLVLYCRLLGNLCIYQVATALLVAGSTLTFWIPPFTSTSSYSSVFKALGCSYNCRRLTDGWFQLTHVTWWPRCLIDRAMAAKTKTKRYYSARQRSLRCRQNLRGHSFPESYTTGSCARAMADNRETKGLITPPPRWVSAQLLYVCVTAW